MATIGLSAAAVAGEPASGGALAAVGNGVSAAAPAPAPEPEAIAGTRMRVDWQHLISGYNIELSKLPANHAESLRLGNGDIGVAVYAVPECVVLFVGPSPILLIGGCRWSWLSGRTTRACRAPLPAGSNGRSGRCTRRRLSGPG